MRIVFLMNRLDRSGGTRVINELSSCLSREGNDIYWHTRPGENSKNTFRSDAKITYPYILKSTSNNLIANVLGYLSLLYKIPKCDALIATYYPTSMIALIAKIMRPNIKIFYLVQSLEGEFSGGWKRLACNATYRFPIHIIVNSKWMESQVIARTGRHISRFHLGLNIKADPAGARKEPRPLKIGCIGRNLGLKRLDDFWGIIRLLQTKYVNDALVPVVISQETINIPSDIFNCKLIKPCNDDELIQAYQSLSLFVSTSALESFGYPPLEAMACSIPVVLTNSGGVLEYAVNGYNCDMSEVGDVNDLSDKIIKIINSPELQAERIANGLHTSETFSWQESAKSFLQILKISSNG